jgi:hypothetical protein
MDERHDAPPAEDKPYDSELDFRAIIRFGVALVLGTLVVLAVMWWMSAEFKREDEAKDPPPPPRAEARGDPIPPAPRLQAAPPRDMDELRAQDEQVLSTYGWVDRSSGVARIPVGRAISILAERGLPKTPEPPASTEPLPGPPAGGSPGSLPAPPAKAREPKKGRK